jgi:hypothetical protein
LVELPQSLAAHQECFGHPPDVLAGHRGTFSAANEALAHRLGVKQIVLPHTGRVSKERQKLEHERWFRRGFRFRAGIEGRIRVLKRDYGLETCLEHGEDGMWRRVGKGRLGYCDSEPDEDSLHRDTNSKGKRGKMAQHFGQDQRAKGRKASGVNQLKR